MSASGRSRTKYTSEVPGTRGPPRGSTRSGSASSNAVEEVEEQKEEEVEEEFSPSAVTSSTSKPQKSQWAAASERRKSNVTFAAPSLAPSDSISKVKSRRGSGDSSGRRASRASEKTTKTSYSKASSRNRTEGSGSAARLTENNLERLNEGGTQDGSYAYDAGEGPAEPRSDEQEQARSTTRRRTRQYEVVEDDRRNSQQYRATEIDKSQATSRRRSTSLNEDRPYRRRSRAANVYEEEQARRYGATTNISRSRTVDSRNSSKKDSASPDAAPTPRRASTQPPNPSNAGNNTSPSAASKSQKSGSKNTADDADVGGSWERHVHLTTKRWPDGREVREREIRLVRAAAA